MTKTVIRIRTMADLNAALKTKERRVDVELVFFCKECFTALAVSAQKILMMKDQAFHCKSHAWGIARRDERSLIEAEFEKRLVPCNGEGLHNAYFYGVQPAK